MAWHTTNIMNQRTEFALRAVQCENFRELCREFGISPKTGYKWKERFIAEGLQGLSDGSRRPKSSPEALSEEVVCRLVKLKTAHRFWGARKLQELYKRSWGEAPSESTIKRVLERCGLVEKKRRRAAVETGRISQGRKATAPNNIWTVDFKGWWKDGGGKSNPLTVRDEFSRFILDLRHLPDGRTATVQECFKRLFERHGLPQAMRSDNGPPFACSHALLGLSRLSAWWLALGIELERSRPGCPQDNGGHERMHKDVKREIQALATQITHTSDESRQAAFDVWRREFNEERPHDSLEMKCPAEVYEKSSRAFKGTPEVISYTSMEARRVHKGGWITYEMARYQISTSLGGWDVGLKAVAGRLEVYFGKMLIGWITPESESFTPHVMKPAPPANSRAKRGHQAGVELDGGGNPLHSATPHSGDSHPHPVQSEAAPQSVLASPSSIT
jgi:transposase InsO family protein